MRFSAKSLWIVLAGLVLAEPVLAADEAGVLVVTPVEVVDEKAVFATIESVNVSAARSRLAGTVASVSVREGDSVARGQVIASIGDEKIALQMRSLDAQIAGLEAALHQAQTDLSLAEALFAGGTITRVRLDEVRTAATVANNSLRARTAERGVMAQQLVEGNVLAPAAGRVLRVPVRAGAVVMAGEEVAAIAQQDFVLRLRIPERHAHSLHVGDVVRIAGDARGDGAVRRGTIRLIYPQIEGGQVVADAIVADLGDYFVGERVRVLIDVQERTAFLIPPSYVVTRYGIDHVRLQRGTGTVEVPIQRGRPARVEGETERIEVLSGLRSGDRLVLP